MGLFLFCVSVSQNLRADIVHLSSESDVLQKAKQEKWFEDVQWLRLVQYQKRLFGGYSSPSETQKFFLSSDGRTNPEQELYATIRGLYKNNKTIKSLDGKFEDPVACVFPARKLYLEKKIGHELPKIACERYERFIEILQPQSLTYVFSAFYLNNPASAFGHTFLRVNKAPSSKDGERYELSDYGVSYAAMKVSENPFVYSFLGVSGFMPGTFEINPYYYKVREYNDFESRDLWEYDIDFTPSEVKMVLAYIWEMLDVRFNYHYFKENCSYRILSFLEVARPSLNLTDVLKDQVMPADTVQTLYEQPGLINNIHFRPSVRSVFDQRYKKLDDGQKSHLRKFARNESVDDLLKGQSVDEQRSSLDAAMDYLDYKYPKEILTKTGKYNFKKEILVKRAQLGGVSEPLVVPMPLNEGPHESHGSRRVGFSYREWDTRRSYLLDFKMSLHDLLDPKDGYPSTAQITMGHFGLAWNIETKNLDFDYATYYEVVSLAPISDFSSGSSWRLKFSTERGYENNCDRFCRWTELSGGAGVTKTAFDVFDLSLWMRLTTLNSPDFVYDQWGIGAGPGVSIRWNQGPLVIMAESYFRYDYKAQNQEFRKHTLGANYALNKSFGIRFYGEDTNHRQRGDLRVYYYY